MAKTSGRLGAAWRRSSAVGGLSHGEGALTGIGWDAGECSDAVQEAMEDILEKTREVGRALRARRSGEALDYGRVASLLSGFCTANVYITDRDGKLLGWDWLPGYSSRVLSESIRDGALPEEFIMRMERCQETEPHDEDADLFDDDDDEERPQKHLMYVPIVGAVAERLGTVTLVRSHSPFLLRDVLIAEYLSNLVGIEILNERSRTVEERSRDRLAVQMAMRALSYSEVESMKHIMAEIDGMEGVAIASKVADRVGVTRSVIVNALRKLESAGLIESRSLGMKGTYIKVLSPLFVEELGIATSDRVRY